MAVSAESLLTGAPNFRDLGGYPAAAGLSVRRRMLFRSDDLSRLTDADLTVVRSMSIGLVVDLRSESERLHRPSRWPEGVVTPEFLYAGLTTDIRAGNDGLRDILEQDNTVAGARRMMLETYKLLPWRSADVTGQLIRKLAAGGAAVLIHCTAGKDRTGFVCACLLHALGVPREIIYRDYLLSGERIDLDAMAGITATVLEQHLSIRVSRSMLDVINSVAHEYLEAAFAAVEAQLGSMDAYLRHCGAGPEVVRELRRGLLHVEP